MSAIASDLWRRFVAGVLLAEGSTRTVGLMRIGIGLLLWARFADEVLPFRVETPPRLLLSVCFFTATTAMVLGLFSRISTAATAVVLAVMMMGFGRTSVPDWHHHHTHMLLAVTAWLALAPTGRSFSMDRWLALRREERGGPAAPPEWGSQYGRVLVGLQVGTLYLWSAWDKTNPGYLSGERLENSLAYLYYGSDYPTWAGFHALCMLGAWGVLIVEYVLPFGLWVKPWQRVLIPLGLTMHAVFYWLLPVGTFTLTMATCYLAFIEPSAFDRFVERWAPPRPTEPRCP